MNYLTARYLAGFFVALAASALGLGAPSRPNILFIVTDDQGPWALGSTGDPNAVTPNLDRLRAQGAYLASCYTPTPVCSPSRASLLTSRYGTEVGITDYIGKSTDQLDPGILTWPKLLKQAGYATGLIGKYHCGNTPQSHPTKLGYGEFSGFISGGETSHDPMVEIDGQERKVEGWTEDIVADLAISFMRRHAEHPFALSVHFWAPHAQEYKNAEGDRTWLPLSASDWNPVAQKPLKLPQPDYPDLDRSRNERMLREYLGSVHSADRNIGRLLNLLDELGLSKNTIVIFTSDNGYNLGHHGIWHKGNGLWLLKSRRDDRPNMWDNSLRLPAMVRWPGVIPAGSTVNDLVTMLDWFPTLAAMTGTPLPAGAVLRGRDVSAVLKGQGHGIADGFFGQYKMRKGADMRSYQNQRWKLVRYLDRSLPDEMYDRVADRFEQYNLMGTDRADVKAAFNELNRRLIESMAAIKDPSLALAQRN